MANDEELSNYRIYLLTVWRIPGGEQDVPSRWRFRLEDPQTGQRHGFTRAEELITALQTELWDQEESEENECN